jgi:hypothetical protein
VLVGGFVENYMIWTEHGEKAPPPTENPLDKMIEDVEFARLFDAYYDDFCAGVSNDDVDGVSEGPSMFLVMMVVTMNLITVISLASPH